MNKTAITFLATLLSTPTLAAFVNEAAASNPFEGASQVRIFGEQTVAGVVAGMGREVPLAEAVSQIVPRTFNVKMLGVERWQGAKISWYGGRNWTEVLRDALKTVPEVSAEVDATVNVVTLSPTAEGRKVISEGQPASTSEWQVRLEDRTIKEAISRWSTVADWRLIWEIPYEFPISAAASFTGTYEQSIESVMKALQSAEVQPQVRFYTGNRVIRVIRRGEEE